MPSYIYILNSTFTIQVPSIMQPTLCPLRLVLPVAVTMRRLLFPTAAGLCCASFSSLPNRTLVKKQDFLLCFPTFQYSPRPSPNQWNTLQLWKPTALENITIVNDSKDRWRDFVNEVQKEGGLSDRLHSVITRLHANGLIWLTWRDPWKIYIPDMKILTSLSACHEKVPLVDSIQQLGVQ